MIYLTNDKYHSVGKFKKNVFLREVINRIMNVKNIGKWKFVSPFRNG